MDTAATDSGYVTTPPTYIYTLSSGIFSYKKNRTVRWKCWSLFNIIAILEMAVSCVLYLLTEDGLRLEDLVLITIGIFSPILTVALQHVCYKFTDNWENLEKILSADFVANLDDDGDLRQNEKVKNLVSPFERKFIRLFSAYLVSLVAFMSIIFLWHSIRGDVDFGNVSNYWHPFPGVHRVNTRQMFLFVSFCQTVSIPGISVTTVSTWLLLSMTILELTNKTVVLEERMKLLTDRVHCTVAAIRENETKIDDMKTARQRELAAGRARNDKEICFRKFDQDLKTCIHHHQILLRAIRLLRPLLNAYFTITLCIFVLVMVTYGFFIISGKGFGFDSNSMRYFTLFLMLMVQMGVHCMVAQHIQNKNDTIAELVYELPWYELSPKYRKNVYIFLCQAQAPVKFYALKTFRFSTYFFPTILKFVYTNTVNLLTYKEKRH